jgi:hypothetical protein
MEPEKESGGCRAGFMSLASTKRKDTILSLMPWYFQLDVSNNFIFEFMLQR